MSVENNELQKNEVAKSNTTMSYLLNTFQTYYHQAKYNGSSITGIRYLHLSHYKGSLWRGGALLGVLPNYLVERAHEKNILFGGAGDLAKKDPYLSCYYWVGPSRFVLLTLNPSYLYQIFFQNQKNISRPVAMENSFNKAFGKHTVFTSSDKEWFDKRKIYKEHVMNNDKLENSLAKMDVIIAKHFEQAAQEKSVNLESFCTKITQDVFAVTQFGAKQHPSEFYQQYLHDYEKINGIVFDGIGTRLWSRFRALFNRGSDYVSPIQSAKKELEDHLVENYVKNNQDNIKSTPNLLKSLIAYDQPNTNDVNLLDQTALEQLSFGFLAGHDTTRLVMQTVIMCLITHPIVLTKLRADIKQNQPDDGKWTRNSLRKLNYLNMVIKEALRLFPAAPIIGYEATEDFTIYDIPYDPKAYKDPEKYEKAKANSDASKRLKVQKGSIISTSTFLEQRLPCNFENPDSFIPERFEKNPKLEFIHQDCTYFPFGLGERMCVGLLFALQETALMLVRFVEKFDFSADIKYPFDLQAIGTLRLKNQVTINLQLRNVNNNNEENLDKEENLENLFR